MQGAQGCTPSPAYMMEILIQGRGPANGWMPRPEIYVIRTIPVYLKNRSQPSIDLAKCRFPGLFGKSSACRKPGERARRSYSWIAQTPDLFFCSPASASCGSAPIRPKGMTYRFLDSEVAGLYQGSAIHEPSCQLREDNATIPADNHWADIKCRSFDNSCLHVRHSACSDGAGG